MKSNQNIGIEISKQNFDTMFQKYLYKMENGSLFEIEDYLTIIRLNNTIEKGNLTYPKAKEYNELFTNKYLIKAVEILDASLWKGGAFYSIKYGLFIGGKPHQNSQYYIKDE